MDVRRNNKNPNIPEIVFLIPASILLSPMEGRIHPASKLAYIAKVSQFSTAINVLNKYFTVEKHGRYVSVLQFYYEVSLIYELKLL